jgi:hypothetical protein
MAAVERMNLRFLDPVRLQAEGGPDALHGRARMAIA